MDEASAPGAEDSRFESWAGQPNVRAIALQKANGECANTQARNKLHNKLRAETRGRTGELQIFGLTLSRPNYRGHTGMTTIATHRKPANHMHEPKPKRNCTNTCTSKSPTPQAQHQVTYANACRDPGSNRGPSDLRSDALPAELSRPYQDGIKRCKHTNTHTHTAAPTHQRNTTHEPNKRHAWSGAPVV